MPDTVERTGKEILLGCRCLRHVRFSASLRRIECGLLARCRRLERIDLPESVEVVCNGAFAECVSCKDFTGGETARYGVKVFAGCESLHANAGVARKIEVLTSDAISTL